jgi:hypothetical protein
MYAQSGHADSTPAPATVHCMPAVVATSPHLDHLVLSVCRRYITVVRQLHQDQTCNERPCLTPFDKSQDGRSHLPECVRAVDRTRSCMRTCRHVVYTTTPQYHTSIQNSAPATQPHQRKGNRGQYPAVYGSPHKLRSFP